MADRLDIAMRRRFLQQRESSRRELGLFMRRLGFLLSALVVMIVVGTAGFVITEGTSVAYSFMWTLDTVSTLA